MRLARQLFSWWGGALWSRLRASWLVLFLVAQAAGAALAGPAPLAAPPQRVVSLLPSLTETVCALGACDRLVGVDRYSTYPPSVRSLPQLGGGLDPNIEAIVALRPDVVLMAGSSRGAQRLQALGVRVVTLEPQTHADVQRAYLHLSALLGVAEPLRAWRAVDDALSAAAATLPAASRGARVYFEVGEGPYAAGEASFIGETLRRLGARNIVPAKLGPFPKLNPEFIVRANPDVIFVVERNAAELRSRPGWQGIRAVREGRVCAFSTEESDALVRPGPRMAEAARLMAHCLRGVATAAVPDPAAGAAPASATANAPSAGGVRP